MAVIAFVAGCIFFVQYRSLDKAEDELNALPTGHIGTAEQAADVERRLSTVAPGVGADRATNEKDPRTLSRDGSAGTGEKM
jgi:hypothetical protein